MADPTEATIEEINSEGKSWKDKVIYNDVKFAGVVPGPDEQVALWIAEGTDPPEVGPVKGWWNNTQKGDRYFKRADGGASGVQRLSNGSSGAGTDEGTRTSIERQVAFKEAAETLRPHYADLDDAGYESELKRLTNLGHSAIQGG